jgi:hypothetical protein
MEGEGVNTPQGIGICKALGLEPDAIRALTISVEADEVLVIAHLESGKQTTDLARELAKWTLAPKEL